MNTSLTSTPGPTAKRPAYMVKSSEIHGKGVFARRKIPAGAKIIEYLGERIGWPEAVKRAELSGGPINHTFFFTLADGRVIDGGSGGNESRWINHSCEPNCEAFEDEGRIFIHAMRDIERGEELNYSYPLIYDGRRTAAVRRAFECHCGAANCTGTMLAPKSRAKNQA